MRQIAKEYTGYNISAIPGRLCEVEHFCCSEWVVARMLIQNKAFPAGYNISTILRKLCRTEIFLLFSLFLNQDKCYSKLK